MNIKAIAIAIPLAMLCVSGCSTQQTLNPTAANNTTSHTTKPSTHLPISISKAKVTKNDGNVLSVSLRIHNSTNKAVSSSPKDFVLVNGNTELSPASDSQIPSQIAADTTVNVMLSFDVNGQLKGRVTPKIGIQPTINEPEIFTNLGVIDIVQPLKIPLLVELPYVICQP